MNHEAPLSRPSSNVRWSPLRGLLFCASLLAAAGLIGVAVWAVVSPTDASARGDQATSRETLQWVDFGDALDRARSENKPLLVNFNAAWCGYCRKMDVETWSHPSVVQGMDGVIPVRVDIDDERNRNGFSGAELARTFRVNGTPTQMLLDPEGRILARAGGYQSSRQLLMWLDSGLARKSSRVSPTALRP